MGLSAWDSAIPGLTYLLHDTAHRAYTDGGTICPPVELCLRALDLTKPSEVRVIILGQDPYYSPDKANGLAFGYNREYQGPLDSSLRNIIAELGADPRSFDRSLEHWARQGVLLLNTSLTVRLWEPLSHSTIGWEEPVRRILQQFATAPVVWMFWGRHADSTASHAGVDTFGPNVIFTSHPSGLSARRGNSPFIGSACFETANKLLKGMGRVPISWK